MAQEPGIRTEQRVDIGYFEGVNALVGYNIGKKTELYHAENARSKTVGTIEKREGQTVLGVNSVGKPFVTSANYGIFRFEDALYRVSVNENPNLSISVSEDIFLPDIVQRTDPYLDLTPGPDIPAIPALTIVAVETIETSEQINNAPGDHATIYYITPDKKWMPLTGKGTNIPGGVFDYTYAEGNLFLANYNGLNRYVKPDGITVVDSSDATGHLYNSPKANTINYYKSRLYLGDYIYDGVRYKTNILRSSYPMGIVALVNNDIYGATSPVTINITDNKYFYDVTGANTYDIYRGGLKITTITVTVLRETNITATFSNGPVDILSADEIWIAGTFSGEKVFRWVNNPTSSGQSIKQYDTFKLAGGDNQEIKMMTNIGNVMMVANNNSMSSWNDYTLENFDLEVGCVSKDGYIKALGTLYFLHYTGVYSTTGGVPTLISSKVQPYITGATKEGKESCAAGKKGTSIFFTLGQVTIYKVDGSVDKILEDVCLEYNILQTNWFVHTNVKASQFETYIEGTDTDRLEFTDTGGNRSVKEFLSGETDDGKNIPMRIDTMKLTMQSRFENVNNPISLLVDVDRGSAIKAFVNLNNGEEYYSLPGDIRKGLSNIKITGKDAGRGNPPVVRMLSVSLRDSSSQICKMSRMTVIFIPTTNDDPQSD